MIYVLVHFLGSGGFLSFTVFRQEFHTMFSFLISNLELGTENIEVLSFEFEDAWRWLKSFFNFSNFVNKRIHFNCGDFTVITT